MSGPVSRRCWTLESARQMLPDVRRRTERAVREVEELLPRRGEGPRVEEQIRRVVSRWVRSMEALGLEIKGLWLVDFDNGSGYYCWRWPEEDLSHFHGYEEGYAGRVRIQ